MTGVNSAAERAEETAEADNILARLRYIATGHPLGVIGAAIMAVIVFAAVFADFITVYDPLAMDAAISLKPPSAQHWLGADFMGRDVYSRIIYGARISLAVGLGSTFLGCVFGVAPALPSGYLGAWADLLLQRLFHVLPS